MRVLLYLIMMCLVSIFTLFISNQLSTKITIERLNEIVKNTNLHVNDNCAGTLISIEKGIILTNFHCINDRVSLINPKITEPISIKQYENDKKIVEVVARIVAYDTINDIAVLKVTEGELKSEFASRISDEQVLPGEKVWIVGNPLALYNSVGIGVISKLNVVVPDVFGPTIMTQIHGSIYPGNSGGAAYNEFGEIVGIPTKSRTLGLPGISETFTDISYIVTIESIKKILVDTCLGSVYDSSIDDSNCKVKSVI